MKDDDARKAAHAYADGEIGPRRFEREYEMFPLEKAFLAGAAWAKERAAVRAAEAVKYHYGYSGEVVADAVRRDAL